MSPTYHYKKVKLAYQASLKEKNLQTRKSLEQMMMSELKKLDHAIRETTNLEKFRKENNDN